MDNQEFESMMRGLGQVRDFVRGNQEGFVVHEAKIPASVDVKAIRTANNMTQVVFAKTYGFTVDSVRDWEQNRRQPERSARILLAMIDKAPETVQQVIREFA